MTTRSRTGAALTLAAVAMATLVLTTTSAHADLVDGLVEYWELDGDYNAGVTVDHVGTLQTTGTGSGVFVAGKLGQGIDLENSVDNQAAVVIGGDENDFDFAEGSMSFSVWYTTESLYVSWQTLLAKGENAAWRVARYSGTGDRMKLSVAGPVVDGKLNLQDGSWHHAVGTYDAITGTQLYVDGILAGSNPAEYNLGGTGTAMQIGGNPQHDGERGWDGIIDDVGIWDRVLTADEVSSIWNDGAGASIGSLIGLAGMTWNGGAGNWADVNWVDGEAAPVGPVTDMPMVIDAATGDSIVTVAADFITGGTGPAASVAVGATNDAALIVSSGITLEATGAVAVGDFGTLNVAGTLMTKTTEITGGTVEVAAAAWLMATREVTVGAAGTLNVDGSLLADSLTLDGTLAGSGTIQINAERQVTLSGTATLARSTGSGTLLIGSDLVFAENAVYECELGGSAENDLLDVTGTVDLDPASVLKFKINGGDLFQAGNYVLIHSDDQEDGLMGRFAAATNLGAYVSAGDGDGLIYTFDELQLTIDKDLHPGDVDLSAATDLSDFNIWNANKFISGTDWTTGDFNGDAVTDLSDFNIWNGAKFTSATGGAAPAPTQIPEPGTLALLVCGLLAIAMRLRRRV